MNSENGHIAFVSKIKKTVKVADPKSREQKAKKILSVMEDFAEKKQLNLKQGSCLDIGCSTCLITTHFVGHFKNVFGMDMDPQAFKIAQSDFQIGEKVKLVTGNALATPFADNSFEAIVCNQIYEHVPDAGKLFEEIFRMLKPGGICYLSAGNKFMIFEPHYKLPFLSWLPQRLADFYVKITRNIDVYREKHYSYWKLKAALDSFQITDYTIKVIKNPGQFHLEDKVKTGAAITRFPDFVLKLLIPIVPTFIFVLVKPNPTKSKYS